MTEEEFEKIRPLSKEEYENINGGIYEDVYLAERN